MLSWAVVDACSENNQESNSISRQSGAFPSGLRNSPGNRNNLADDFSVLVKAVFFIAAKIAGVGIDHESTVLDSATPGEMGPVAFQNDIDWLLPKRLRPKVKRCLSPAVDHDHQCVYQIGMQRIMVSADPEEVIQGDVR